MEEEPNAGAPASDGDTQEPHIAVGEENSTGPAIPEMRKHEPDMPCQWKKICYVTVGTFT